MWMCLKVNASKIDTLSSWIMQNVEKSEHFINIHWCISPILPYSGQQMHKSQLRVPRVDNGWVGRKKNEVPSREIKRRK